MKCGVRSTSNKWNEYEEEKFHEAARLKAKLLIEGVSISTDIEKIKVEFATKPKLPSRRIPSTLILDSNGRKVAVEVRLNPSSTITLEVADGEIIAKDKGKVIRGVEFPKLSCFFTKILKCGLKVHEIFNPRGDRVDLYLCDGCWFYAVEGYACAFCRPFHGMGKIKPRAIEWSENSWNSYKSLVDEASQFLVEWKPEPHRHLLVSAGALPDYDKQWLMALELIKIVNEHVDTLKIDSYINLLPPKDFRLMDKTAAFFRNCMINMEVYDTHIFNSICKGKAVTYGYDKIVDALKYAVDVFGTGNVRSNFVLGAEPLKSFLKGAEELARMGIAPSATVFWPKPGSPWEKRDPPTLSEITTTYRGLARIYRDYGLKPFCCELGSRSSLENEAWRGWL
jgi:hypothetical protein